MNHSWELACATVRAERCRHPHDAAPAVRERYAEHVTRLTVLTGPNIGVATQFHGADGPDLDDLAERAVASVAPTQRDPVHRTSAAMRSPGEIPDRTDLRAMAWLQDIGGERTRVDCTVEDSSGSKIDTCVTEAWRDAGVHGHLVARVPAGAPISEDERPEWTPRRLLFAPWVLSQILLEPIMNGLVGCAPLRRWPAEILIDPGWGGGVDCEGTPRRPTVLTAHRRLQTAPLDRLRAWTTGREVTGHAGFTGAVVRDLVVLPAQPVALAVPPGTLVVEAACLARDIDGASAMLALSALAADGGLLPAVRTELGDITDLLDAGQWCGPWQRGHGPWTSHWLAMGVSSRWLRTRQV
jgi:hypothetical protein